MAVYKVPQDVEADDKLFGPFTFKQFWLVIATIFGLFLTFNLFASSAPILGVIPLPFTIITGILGLWPRKDQPVEVYIGALIRFWFKERKRLWSQEGMTEHVIITAPKRVVHAYSDGLSRNEIQSRLKNLADSLDSRGWTAKNLEVQDVQSGVAAPVISQPSDRLVMPKVYKPQAQPDPMDIHQSDDMLDQNNNPTARNVAQLAQQAAEQQRQEAITALQTGQVPQDNQTKFNPYPDMQQRVINPAGTTHATTQKLPPAQSQQAPPPLPQPTQPLQTEDQNTTAMTPEPSPAILELSRNSDLNISTLARQAEESQSLHDDDVIELH